MANELSHCKYTRLLVNEIIFLPFFEKITLKKYIYQPKKAQKVHKTKNLLKKHNKTFGSLICI